MERMQKKYIAVTEAMNQYKKMGKVLILLVCFIIALLLFVSQVYAETEETVVASGKDGGIEWSLDSCGVLLISGINGSGGILNYDQNTTYAPWHEYGSQVKTIVLQDGVTSIGNYAFYDCVYATEIDLGQTVKTIGKYAFNCSFTSFYIPASVTSINEYAFNFTQGKLTRYMVSEDNLYYSSDDKGVLFNKSKTELLRAPDCLEGSYTVPDSVVTIKQGFRRCSKLTNLVISNSVTSIDSSSLSGCGNLQTLDIGDGITEFGYLFSNSKLDGLTSISIGKGLNSADGGGSINVFAELKALEEINVCQENESFVSVDGVLYNKEKTILVAFPRGKTGSFQVPDGITEIRGNAFSGSNITEIVIPDSVTKLDGFKDCCNLKTFIMPDGVETIPQFCFSGCLNLQRIQISESVKYIKQYAFSDCVSLTEITFPASLSSIANKVFEGCEGLSKVTFEGGAPKIDDTAFTGVTAICYYPVNILTWTDDVKTNYGGTLTWISYEVDQFEGQEYTFMIPGTNITLAYKIDEETNSASIVLCNSDAIGNLEIPDIIDGYTVTDIAESAFKDCVGLTGVTIPDSVKTIGCHAFDGCTKMASVNIPDTITVIEDYAFANSGLTAIEIPNTVVEIGPYAFRNTKVVEFTIPEGVSIVGTGAFSYNSCLTEVTLPDSLTYIADYMFENCKYLIDVVLPENLITVGDAAFSTCLGLNSMTLPEGVISIGEKAFLGCGAYDLYGMDYICNRFTSITLPSTLKYIGKDAFGLCQSLKSIEIPDGVTRIEEYTFRSCYRLKNVKISSSCVFIGTRAFLQCKELGNVTFRWNAPEIDIKAFNNTTTTCYYPSNNEAWIADKFQNYGGKLTWVAKEMEKPEGSGSGEGESVGEDEGKDTDETGGSKDPIDVIIDNNTSSAGDGASVTPPENGWTKGENTFNVESQSPCAVLISQDGGITYTRLPATDIDDGTYSFTAEDMSENTVLSIVLLGDVNNDGNVTNADVTMLRAAVLGKTDLSTIGAFAADVNGDASITNADVTMLCAVFLDKSELSW